MAEIAVVLPSNMVKKYFPLINRWPRRYRFAQHVMNFSGTFFRNMTLMFSGIIIFLVFIWIIIPKDNIVRLYMLQGTVIYVLSLVILCCMGLLFTFSYNKEFYQDVALLKRLLQDEQVMGKNTANKINLNVLIPLLAIKKFYSDDEIRWLPLLPRKYASSEKMLKRYQNYHIGGETILDSNGCYKEWKFTMDKETPSSKIISQIFNHMWDELLRAEISLLKKQTQGQPKIQG